MTGNVRRANVVDKVVVLRRQRKGRWLPWAWRYRIWPQVLNAIFSTEKNAQCVGLSVCSRPWRRGRYRRQAASSSPRGSPSTSNNRSSGSISRGVIVPQSSPRRAGLLERSGSSLRMDAVVMSPDGYFERSSLRSRGRCPASVSSLPLEQ